MPWPGRNISYHYQMINCNQMSQLNYPSCRKLAKFCVTLLTVFSHWQIPSRESPRWNVSQLMSHLKNHNTPGRSTFWASVGKMVAQYGCLPTSGPAL